MKESPTSSPTSTAAGSTRGDCIRALRKKAGLTHDQLAELAGISPSYLSRAENGQVVPTDGWLALVTTAVCGLWATEVSR